MATTSKIDIQNPLIGEIKMFAASTPPVNWLICDGSAVSRTTYSNLFSVIGTTYGSGDGSTTFNIPDFRGRVAVGVGENSTTGHTNHTLGQLGGNESHTHPSSVAFSRNYYPGQGLAYTNGGSVPYDPPPTGSSSTMQPYTTINYIIYGGGN